MVRNVFLSFVLGSVVMIGVAPRAAAQVYINGSVSQSSSNLVYIKSNSGSGSLGVDVALGRYVRIGVAHSQEFAVAEGWVTKEGVEDTSDDPADFNEYSSRTHAWANSIDFTFILYEGDIVVPYLKAGLIWKTYMIEEKEAGIVTREGYRNRGPGDNLGAGIGFKLNKDFTLKFLYTTSPGYQAVPGENEIRLARDKKATVGLSYEL